MLSTFFDRFKKVKEQSAPAKTMDELEREFDKMKVAYATVGTSEVYTMLKEYFLVKIEINRDLIELTTPIGEDTRTKIVQAQAEIRVMRDFIADIEEMKNLIVQDQQMTGEAEAWYIPGQAPTPPFIY